MSKHIGSKFDDFLDEEGLLAEAEAVATKRVIAFQFRELMKKQKLTRMQLAKWMKTSRSAFERLLDPDNVSVRLLTWSVPPKHWVKASGLSLPPESKMTEYDWI